MIRRPPRSTLSSSSAASDVYKRQHRDGLLQARFRARTKLGELGITKVNVLLLASYLCLYECGVDRKNPLVDWGVHPSGSSGGGPASVQSGGAAVISVSARPTRSALAQRSDSISPRCIALWSSKCRSPPDGCGGGNLVRTAPFQGCERPPFPFPGSRLALEIESLQPWAAIMPGCD